MAFHELSTELADRYKGKRRQKEDNRKQQINCANLIPGGHQAHIELFAKRNCLQAVGPARQPPAQENQETELPCKERGRQNQRYPLFAA